VAVSAGYNITYRSDYLYEPFIYGEFNLTWDQPFAFRKGNEGVTEWYHVHHIDKSSPWCYGTTNLTENPDYDGGFAKDERDLTEEEVQAFFRAGFESVPLEDFEQVSKRYAGS